LGLRQGDSLVSAAPLRYLERAFGGGIRLPGVRVVAVSSASAATKAGSPWPFDHALSLSLRSSEDALIAALGTAVTVLRPTMIYGSGRDRNVARLAGMIRRFRIAPIFGSGRGLRAPIHVDDLAAVVVRVAMSEVGAGEALHVPGAEVLEYREMLSRIAESCGVSAALPKFPEFPSWITLLAARLPPSATRMLAAASRMNEDLTVPDDVASLGVPRRMFRPDRRAVGLDTIGIE
jgi:nucleoside-diphosphate-sugar epimerase